ncbi:PIR Superfamily Protein [Plasmodium ovale wallikeri]|uniref:PIR protein n=2 Tax=Plasmodium ovale TaxID=36330 RepID=A0A1C3KIK4_PLAOA|nr:PIR Superfamily Protein [Plasmodium ovale wallikeri]SBT73630.1 PIR protein [Plasmodium ovale]
MTPNDVTAEERYGFFEMFDQYATKERSTVRSSEGVSYCDSYSGDDIFTNVGSPQEFCKKFKYLYNILKSSRAGNQDGEIDKNDCAFLNYWLNDKLRGANADTTICVKTFYQKLKSEKDTFLKSALLEEKIYNIEKHDLENMRRLYDLYNIKSNVSEAIAKEMENEESISCLTYTKECFGKYRDAIIKCLGDCPHFYSVLKEFKRKFEEELSSYTKTSISCKHKELFELPDYGVVIKEDKSVKIIRNTSILVLFPVFGVIFMLIFSDKLIPISQQILEKIKRTKNMLFGAGEKSNELLSYTSDNDNIFGDHEEYSLSYYSVRNY